MNARMHASTRGRSAAALDCHALHASSPSLRKHAFTRLKGLFDLTEGAMRASVNLQGQGAVDACGRGILCRLLVLTAGVLAPKERSPNCPGCPRSAPGGRPLQRRRRCRAAHWRCAARGRAGGHSLAASARHGASRLGRGRGTSRVLKTGGQRAAHHPLDRRARCDGSCHRLQGRLGQRCHTERKRSHRGAGRGARGCLARRHRGLHLWVVGGRFHMGTRAAGSRFHKCSTHTSIPPPLDPAQPTVADASRTPTS